jgi:CspA family cold shock protein
LFPFQIEDDPPRNTARRFSVLIGMLMSIGTVKWFNTTKGYGFIQPEDGSKDVFLHISDVQRAGMDVREGDKLSYVIQSGQQGKLSAGNLRQA